MYIEMQRAKNRQSIFKKEQTDPTSYQDNIKSSAIWIFGVRVRKDK